MLMWCILWVIITFLGCLVGFFELTDSCNFRRVSSFYPFCWTQARLGLATSMAMWKHCQLFFVLFLLSGYVHCLRPSFQGSFISRLTSSVCRRYELRSLSMQAGSVPFRPKPTPGSPIVRYIYSNNNLALLSVCVPGLATKKAFAETCDRFNEVLYYHSSTALTINHVTYCRLGVFRTREGTKEVSTG